MKNDIRFLVTNTCNYHCYFCHNEGMEKKMNYKELNVEDYVLLFSIYSEMEEWNGVTLSGGEPLIYKNIDELVKRLYEAGAEITIVTNGSLLKQHLPILKYIGRINVSIHTLDNLMYEKITGRTHTLNIVKENLELVRKLYPKLHIRLNITPCKDNNWNLDAFKQLIEYSRKIQASIKLTELFPNTDPSTVTIEELIKQLEILGYTEIVTDDRTRLFKSQNHYIYLTQCTCSKAIQTKSPITYCRENHDLYINHDGTVPLCRLGKENLNIIQELEGKNIEMLKKKIELAKLRVSSDICYKYLLSTYQKYNENLGGNNGFRNKKSNNRFVSKNLIRKNS